MASGRCTAPAAIIEDVINYAAKADKPGFSRFWLTEDHNLSLAWNSPKNVRQVWDLGAYIGINIVIRVLNILFGGALAAVDESCWIVFKIKKTFLL